MKKRRNKPLMGIAVLCQDPDGNIIGTPYKTSRSDLRERIYEHGQKGEHWGIMLTEIARKYPYPEIPGFVPEGLVALEMAKDYDEICINEPLRIYYPSADGLSRDYSRYFTYGSILYAQAMLRRDWRYAWRFPGRFSRAGLVLLASPVILLYGLLKPAGRLLRRIVSGGVP